MSKLQKFNHILFALLGSGIILFAAYGLILTAIRFYHDWTQPDDAPLSDQKVIELTQDNKFKQAVSFEQGYWAWTDIITLKDGTKKNVVSPYYIIPVSQATLENEMEMKARGFAQEPSMSRSYRTPWGKYNNVLIYNKSNNSIKKIFDQRLLVNNIDVRKYQEDYFAIIQTQSLSKEEKSDNPRLSDYYIYNFVSEKLTKFALPALDNITFITDENLPYFLLRGRIDFDENGKFDRYDPYRLFLWNYETYDVTPFPGDAFTDDLQKTLEGRYLKK